MLRKTPSFITTGCARIMQMIIAVLVLSSSLFSATSVVAQTIIPRPPQIAASSYILLDARTGKIIVEENSDESLPPASLTKIMTAYVAAVELASGNLKPLDEVHISEKAWRMDGSKMFVRVGTKVTVEDLLRGIVIQSGNDASVAIAEHIAGSEDAFADMMNQHAVALGLTNSFFMNSSGNDTDEYYNRMSARDLGTLARAVINQYPEHYKLYAEREFTYNEIRQPNRNKLLFRDRNIDGMKTGFTEAAGYCLVASGERNNMRLISVVMGTVSEESRAVESQKLLTYGFRYYETHKLYEANEVLSTTRIWSAKQNSLGLGVEEEVYITIPRGQVDELRASMDIDETIRGQVEKGQIFGTVNVTLDNDILYQGNVIALETIERGGFFKRFVDALVLFFTNLFG